MAENVGEVECFKWFVTLSEEVRGVVDDEGIDEAEVGERKI